MQSVASGDLAGHQHDNTPTQQRRWVMAHDAFDLSLCPPLFALTARLRSGCQGTTPACHSASPSLCTFGIFKGFAGGGCLRRHACWHHLLTQGMVAEVVGSCCWCGNVQARRQRLLIAIGCNRPANQPSCGCCLSRSIQWCVQWCLSHEALHRPPTTPAAGIASKCCGVHQHGGPVLGSGFVYQPGGGNSDPSGLTCKPTLLPTGCEPTVGSHLGKPCCCAASNIACRLPRQNLLPQTALHRSGGHHKMSPANTAKPEKGHKDPFASRLRA